MSDEERSIDAVEQVLDEDPRTRETPYSWTFLVKVLNKLGIYCNIQFRKGMPSPETLFRERREILYRRNKYGKDFMPEEGVTYEKPNNALLPDKENSLKTETTKM